MPLYDFQCEDCEHVIEDQFLTRKQAERDMECPKCGGRARRVFGLGHVQYHMGYGVTRNVGNAPDFEAPDPDDRYRPNHLKRYQRG